MSPQSFYFNPDGKDVEVFVGPLEAELLRLLWKHKQLTVKKAMYYLSDNPGRAYTTIMTVLNRLYSKGLVARSKESKHFIYTPAVSHKELIKQKLASVQACLKQFK